MLEMNRSFFAKSTKVFLKNTDEYDRGEKMRTFKLIRRIDEPTTHTSGISGTGIVAVGIDYGNGLVVTTWIVKAHTERFDGSTEESEISTLTFFKSTHDVQKLHGHGTRTLVVMDDVIDVNTVRLIESKMIELNNQLKRVS